MQTQTLCAISPGFPAINITQVTPHHRLHQRVVIDLLHVRKRFNVMPIFKYGNGIAKGKNLFHTVRNIQNDAPFIAQFTDNAKQILNLACRKGTGRFIKSDNFGVTRQRFCNLHHLPLTNGEVFQWRIGVDIHAQMLKL